MADNELTSFLPIFTERKATAENAVVRAAAGDKEAFEALYTRYAPMVHAILIARVSIEDAEDLSQEVFLTAHRKIATLKDHEKFGAWLAAIARNRANEFWRTHRTAVEITDEIGAYNDRACEAAEMLRVIRSLPDAYNETLMMRLVEGMTGPEIAEKTGLSPDSVRVNLFRGMKILREKLGLDG